MHNNRHVHSPVIITTTLYSTRMAHIFIRVCALIYNGISPSTFACHLGHQYLPQTTEVIPCLLSPPPRCSRHRAEAQMHGPDRSGHVACRRNKRIDQHHPQSAGGAQTGMQDPGVSCKAIHVTVFGARQFHSSAMSHRLYK